MKTSNTLTLQILNNECLASGKRGTALFTADGGTIGSAENNDWPIQNQSQAVESLHAKIEVVDSYFCISAYAPRLQLNNVDLFTKAKSVRLQHGDLLSLDDLKIKVRINENGIASVDPLATRPEDIISNYQDPLKEILSKEKATFSDTQRGTKVESGLIPPIPLDPMKILDSESPRMNNNYFAETTAFNSPNDNVLEQSVTLNAQSDRFFNPEEKSANIAVNPLFRGLKDSIPLRDSQEAYDFLEEIGHSIKTIVEGLKDLHSNNRYLADKHLRPIEDNPLRLNLSYKETLGLLYSTEKCPVHLSAPSAIAESLNNIRLHHEANQLAISEALSALLEAFAPQALMGRFLRYRRSSEKTQTDSAWAWNMYSSYYSELISKRQKGFDKLFWEVYEQAYDRNIRKLQQNQDEKGLL